MLEAPAEPVALACALHCPASIRTTPVSWLLRNAPVGFEAQDPVVHGECFVAINPWCFASGSAFAPSQADSLAAIADRIAIVETLSP